MCYTNCFLTVHEDVTLTSGIPCSFCKLVRDMTLFWVLFTNQIAVSQNESLSPSISIGTWKDHIVPWKSRGQNKEAQDLYEQGRYHEASRNILIY